jgi:hypothetical protein
MADAMRLLFGWSEGKIRLLSARRVAKRAPAGDPVARMAEGDGTPPRIGVFLELREGERPVYRRQLGPLFPDSHEVQTGDPRQPFARVPRRKPYTVEVIIPAMPKGARLLLTERRADPQAARSAAPPAPIIHVDEALKGEDQDSTQGRP